MTLPHLNINSLVNYISSNNFLKALSFGFNVGGTQICNFDPGFLEEMETAVRNYEETSPYGHSFNVITAYAKKHLIGCSDCHEVYVGSLLTAFHDNLQAKQKKSEEAGIPFTPLRQDLETMIEELDALHILKVGPGGFQPPTP